MNKLLTIQNTWAQQTVLFHRFPSSIVMTYEIVNIYPCDIVIFFLKQSTCAALICCKHAAIYENGIKNSLWTGPLKISEILGDVRMYSYLYEMTTKMSCGLLEQ